ncbi:hypothetical protein D3C74_499340 [compost metagenome]
MAPTPISSTSSKLFFSLLSTWMEEVEIKVWMRKASATRKASPAASISLGRARARAQTRLFLM